MLNLSKTIFVYRFYKILVVEPTTEVKAESIGAPSVKEIGQLNLSPEGVLMLRNSTCPRLAGLP
jgi:hypothetical protein